MEKKKEPYVKPLLIVEDFKGKQSIANTCEVMGNFAQYECAADYFRRNIFTYTLWDICEYMTSEGFIDELCYSTWGDNGGFNVFNS